jgi:uncharacterized iron-regulated membrane protein
MSGLEILLAVAGFLVTALVVAGMILITPRGEVELSSDVRESQGAELSRADTREAVRT